MEASPPMAKQRVSEDELIRALVAAEGNVTLAAEVVGLSPITVNSRIENNPRIAAAAGKTIPMTETEIETRKPMLVGRDREEGDAVLGQVVAAQEADLIRDGLRKAGIKDSTLEKLRTLTGLNVTGGRFLVATMDLAHRMTVYQSVALLEEAEHIKNTYLHNEELTQEERYNWQRAYNEIAELIGKTFDRTLAGTQAMVAMQRGTSSDPKRSGKPGPSALNEKPVLPA